jgi:acetolactate synthase-1/2/3 large subunit
MIRVADFIFQYLADYGIKHVFLVVGGGAMHLNDALKKETRIQPICMHHEQGAAIAAEGYSRTTNKLSVVSVTSGPGGTNTLTGVLGQWTDSVPVLYISGQVKFETTINSSLNLRLRQLGDQEANIIRIVSPITKYAKTIINPYIIKKELEKAIQIATSGRPGPVWLDIPLDVQSFLIDENTLVSYKKRPPFILNSKREIKQSIALLIKSSRPLVIAGNGIRLSGAQTEFKKFIEEYNLPVVTTFNGFDLLSNEHPNFIGRIGTLGSRAGNFALQNADVVLCLGTRNNIRQVSYAWQNFAKNAKIIIVDIDFWELHKRTVKGDVLVWADVKSFLNNLLNSLLSNEDFKIPNYWMKWCQERKNNYPLIVKKHFSYMNAGNLNPYIFIEELTSLLKEGDIVVAGNGTACVTLFQAGIVKYNQRMFWNSGCASMGYDLPASIGASIATGKKVICLAGDGSLQMNIQELQTLKHHKLPIKLFVLNNKGYHSIIQTQTTFFEGNSIGCGEQSGISFPDYKKLADLYDLKYHRIDSISYLFNHKEEILDSPESCLCEVVLDTKYVFAPKLSSTKKEEVPWFLIL